MEGLVVALFGWVVGTPRTESGGGWLLQLLLLVGVVDSLHRYLIVRGKHSLGGGGADEWLGNSCLVLCFLFLS